MGQGLQRLVYAPKVYAFVASTSLGQIIDVSDDIVSGEVHRITGDASTASLVLRNHNFKYIRSKGIPNVADNTPIFRPNDLITIWLQRISGKPIQVFTGYLDEVPYYQMYPDNCRIEATCTLKKLAYSWFDPGLDFFINFANSFSGWTYVPTSGEASNPNLMYGLDGMNEAELAKNRDGGFATLLYQFMTLIAGWAPDKVLITELDENLPDKAMELYNKLQESVEQDQTAAAEALRQMMGISTIGSVDGVTESGRAEASVLKITKIITSTVSAIPPIVAVFAAYHRTKYQPQYWSEFKLRKGGINENYGYGLFAARPLRLAYDYSDPTNTAGSVSDTIQGTPVASLRDAGAATRVFYAEAQVAIDALFSEEGGNGPARKAFMEKLAKGDASAIKSLMKKMNYPVVDKDLTHDLEIADRYLKSFNGEAVNQPGSENTEGTPAVLTWDSPEFLDLLDANEEKLVRDKYSKHQVELVPYIYLAKKTSEDLKLKYVSGMRREEVYIHYSTDAQITDGTFGAGGGVVVSGGEVDPLIAYFKRFDGQGKKGDEYQKAELWVEQTGTDSYLSCSKGVISGGDGRGTFGTDHKDMKASDTVRVTVKDGSKNPDWVGLPLSADTTDNANGAGLENGFKFSDLGRFVTNAALAAQYSFPVNTVESRNLTGNRALMNDISCMDGAKQFVQASMRNMQSLPDGRFLAFYPDYFGAKRKPYWSIYDIEIINMGIQLNDRALATHVYVPGDTAIPDGKVDWQDKIYSKGVVTIMDVELLNSFINPGYESVTTEAQERTKINFDGTKAAKFLSHYGARVLVEESPIIRNPFYEFLMAWQRFMQQWASQFATRVDFTFQPEVYPGGLLAFPDHYLQMYVEEVTHTFAYDESGFNTTAVLSSPSKMGGADPNELPGMVLAGSINTVGFTSGA